MSSSATERMCISCPCDNDNDCEYYCESNVCQNKTPLYRKCHSYEGYPKHPHDCGPGQWCDYKQDFTCRKRKQNGENCVIHESCLSNRCHRTHFKCVSFLLIDSSTKSSPNRCHLSFLKRWFSLILCILALISIAIIILWFYYRFHKSHKPDMKFRRQDNKLKMRSYPSDYSSNNYTYEFIDTPIEREEIEQANTDQDQIYPSSALPFDY
ncbi:hypothetical protein I4U23_016664 [Adineta vaga]|nr:hypothetical protein I4U23_016664 [Adineta vaga]